MRRGSGGGGAPYRAGSEGCRILKVGIPFDTVVKIQKIKFLLLERLLDPLLVPLWGPFWTPFGLHVGPFGDSWGLQLDLFGHFWVGMGTWGMMGSAMKFTEWSGPFTSSINNQNEEGVRGRRGSWLRRIGGLSADGKRNGVYGVEMDVDRHCFLERRY